MMMQHLAGLSSLKSSLQASNICISVVVDSLLLKEDLLNFHIEEIVLLSLSTPYLSIINSTEILHNTIISIYIFFGTGVEDFFLNYNISYYSLMKELHCYEGIFFRLYNTANKYTNICTT